MIIGANAVLAVYKLVYGSKVDSYPVVPDMDGLEAYIESKSGDLMQVLGEQANIEVFDMFCDPIDIDTGDKVVDDHGREYRVTGIERHENNRDCDDYYKVTLNSKRNL